MTIETDLKNLSRDLQNLSTLFERFLAANDGQLEKPPVQLELPLEDPADEESVVEAANDPEHPPTLDDVRDVLQRIAENDTLGPKTPKQILKTVGFSKLSELTTDLYKEVIDRAEQALAEVA